MVQKINYTDVNTTQPQNSPLNRSNAKKNKPIDRITQQEAREFFRANYAFDDDNKRIFNRIWNNLRIDRKKPTQLFKDKQPISLEKMRTIAQQLEKKIIYNGEGCQAPQSTPLDKKSPVSEIVHALLHHGPLTKNLLRKSLMKAIFVKKDVKFLDEFRGKLQEELINLSTHLPKNNKEELVWRGFFGNIIALLPYTYPPTGSELTLPILDKGKCTLVTYSIESINLDASKYASPMTVLGMTPKDNAQAPDMLSFIGTTYPAGQGFASTVLADFTPGYAVGERVYKKNLHIMDAWFNGKKNVQAYGMSLGGAMGMHAYRHHSSHLASVNVFNPPGLNRSCWKKKISSDCQLNIFIQPNDLVSKVGFWATTENVNIFSVHPHRKEVGHNPLLAHARAYTGCQKITVLRKNPNRLNKHLSRKLLTWLHQFIAPVLIWFPLSTFLFIRHQFRRW